MALEPRRLGMLRSVAQPCRRPPRLLPAAPAEPFCYCLLLTFVAVTWAAAVIPSLCPDGTTKSDVHCRQGVSITLPTTTTALCRCECGGNVFVMGVETPADCSRLACDQQQISNVCGGSVQATAAQFMPASNFTNYQTSSQQKPRVPLGSICYSMTVDCSTSFIRLAQALLDVDLLDICPQYLIGGTVTSFGTYLNFGVCNQRIGNLPQFNNSITSFLLCSSDGCTDNGAILTPDTGPNQSLVLIVVATCIGAISALFFRYVDCLSLLAL